MRERRRKQEHGKHELEEGSSRDDEELLEPHSSSSSSSQITTTGYNYNSTSNVPHPTVFSSSSSVSTRGFDSSHHHHQRSNSSTNNNNVFARAPRVSSTKQQHFIPPPYYTPNPLHRPQQLNGHHHYHHHHHHLQHQLHQNNDSLDTKLHLLDISSSHHRQQQRPGLFSSCSALPSSVRYAGPCSNNDYIVTLPPEEAKSVIRQENDEHRNIHNSLKVENNRGTSINIGEENCSSNGKYLGKEKLVVACSTSNNTTNSNGVDLRRQVDTSHHHQFGQYRDNFSCEAPNSFRSYSKNSYQHPTNNTVTANNSNNHSSSSAQQLINNPDSSGRPNYAYGCKKLYPCGPEVLIGLTENNRNDKAPNLSRGTSNVQKPGIKDPPAVKPKPEKPASKKPKTHPPKCKNLILVSELQRQLSAPVRYSNTWTSHPDTNGNHKYIQHTTSFKAPEISNAPLKAEKSNESGKQTSISNADFCRMRVPTIEFWRKAISDCDTCTNELMESNAQNTEQQLVRNRRSLMQSTPRRFVRDGEYNQQQLPGVVRVRPPVIEPTAFSVSSTSTATHKHEPLTSSISSNNMGAAAQDPIDATSSAEGSVAGDEVLDLRKSVADKLCVWCGKQTGIREDGVGNDCCSDVCFNLWRRDTFKKRSNCLWCSSLGISAIGGSNSTSTSSNNKATGNSPPASNTTITMDESKFCSEECLTKYKVKLFCDETSAHLEQFKGSNVNASGSVVASSSRNPVGGHPNDLITPELWLPNKLAMGNGSKPVSTGAGIFFTSTLPNKTALSSDCSTPAVSPHSSPNSEASSVPIRSLLPPSSSSRHSSSSSQQHAAIIQNQASGIMNPLFIQNGHTSGNGNNGQAVGPSQLVSGRRRIPSPPNIEPNSNKSSRKRKHNQPRPPSSSSSGMSVVGGFLQNKHLNGHTSPPRPSSPAPNHTVLHGPLAHGSGGGIQSPRSSRPGLLPSNSNSNGQAGGLSSAGPFSPPNGPQQLFHGPPPNIPFHHQQQHMGINGNLGFQSLLQQTQALLNGFGNLSQLSPLAMINGAPGGPFGTPIYNQTQGERPFPNLFSNMPYTHSTHSPRSAMSVGTQTIEKVLANPLNLSGAPPITIMVPYPIAIPIPVPIPIILPDEYVLRQIADAVNASQSEVHAPPSASVPVSNKTYKTNKLYIAENCPSEPVSSHISESETKERNVTSTVEIAVHENGDLRIIRTVDEDEKVGNMELRMPEPSGRTNNTIHLQSVVVEIPETLKTLINSKDGSCIRGQHSSEDAEPPVLRIEDISTGDNRVHSNAGTIFRTFLRSIPDANKPNVGEQPGPHRSESNGN